MNPNHANPKSIPNHDQSNPKHVPNPNLNTYAAPPTNQTPFLSPSYTSPINANHNPHHNRATKNIYPNYSANSPNTKYPFFSLSLLFNGRPWKIGLPR